MVNTQNNRKKMKEDREAVKTYDSAKDHQDECKRPHGNAPEQTACSKSHTSSACIPNKIVFASILEHQSFLKDTLTHCEVLGFF